MLTGSKFLFFCTPKKAGQLDHPAATRAIIKAEKGAVIFNQDQSCSGDKALTSKINSQQSYLEFYLLTLKHLKVKVVSVIGYSF